MPEDKREALRIGGGLPATWFASFDDNGFLLGLDSDRPEIVFWPHVLDYGQLSGSAGEGKPQDVATHLGEKAATEQQEKHRHIREVYSAFCNTVAVHVVFLDAKKPGDVSEYLHLRSFTELGEWCGRFRKALDLEFLKRTNAMHILVIIVSGEKIQTNDDELGSFTKMFGVSGFSRCYIMDESLGRGAKGMQFHAAEMWRPMLERLLLYFVLAEEEGRGQDAVPDSGIYVWQAFECRLCYFFGAADESIDRVVIVNDILNGEASEPLTLGGIPSPPPLLDREGAEVEYQKISFGKGWSGYPVAELGKTCAKRQRFDSSRWDAVKHCASSIGEVITNCRATLSDWLSSPVHETPALKTYVGTIRSAMDREVGAAAVRIKGEDGAKAGDAGKEETIADTVASILKMENERQEALSSLLVRDDLKTRGASAKEENLAEAVCKAQKYYVGLFKGLICLGVLAAMAGWTIHKMTEVLGGSLLFSVHLAVAFAFGGFGMLLFMWSCQLWAGNKAVRKLIEVAKKSDKAFWEKDLKARRLVFSAQARHCHLVRLGMLSHLHNQLDRALKVLDREMTEILADRGKTEGEAVDDAAQKEKSDGLLKAFERETVQELGRIVIREDIEADGASALSLKKKIVDSWKHWCGQDGVTIGKRTYRSGYLPASFIYREIRKLLLSHLSHWQEKRRTALRDSVAGNAAQENVGVNVLEALKAWCAKQRRSTSSEFASADVKDVVIRPRSVQRFYIPRSPLPRNDQLEDPWKGAVEVELDKAYDNVGEECHVVSSGIIEESRTFALFYREIPVEFGHDEHGVLLLKRRDDE